MKTKTIILLFIFSFKISGQIFFKNSTNEPVIVSLAMYYSEKNFKYLGSEGWWRIEPGEKKTLSNAVGLHNQIYYYAYSATSSKKYEGSTKLIVHPTDKFFIKNCEKAYVIKEDKHLVYRNFRSVDMDLKILQTKYTIDLTF